MAKIIIAELDLNTDALTKKAVVTKKAIQDLKDAQKILQIQGKQNSTEFVKNEIALKKLSTSYREQTKVLGSLTSRSDEFIKVEKAIDNAVNKNINTIAQARKSNKDLLAVRNELNLNSVEGQKQLTRINSKLDKNNKVIKQNVSGYEQQKIGIGNYTGALGKFFPRISGAITQGIALKNSLVLQKQAMNASATATGTASKALRIFRIALISTGIGAIVVAVGTLIAAFSSTQKGADGISKALAPIKGAFQGIIGVIQDISLNIFGQLSDRFLIVKNNLLNGIDLIRLGWNTLTGDTEEAADVQSKMIERTKQMGEAQVRLNAQTAKLGNIFKGAGDEIAKSVLAQKEIERLTISIETKEAEIVLSRAKAGVELRKLQLIANDRSKSAEENNAAADKAIVIAKKLASEEKNLVGLKVLQEELRQSQNDTDRKDLKKLNEIKAEGIAADEKASATELKFLTAKSNLKKIQAQEEAKARKDEDDVKAEKEAKELEGISAFEERKKQLLNEIKSSNAEDEEQDAILKAEKDFEKQEAEFEKMNLTSEQKKELLALLTTNEEQVKADIRQHFLDQELEMLKESNVKIIKGEEKQAAGRLRVASSLTRSLSKMLGDSLGARLASIAIQAGVEAGLVKMQAASASGQVASNTAIAVSKSVAASPLTGGLPFSAAAIAAGGLQQASIAASSTSAISTILGSAALKGLSSLASFDKGGVVGLGSGKITNNSNIPTQSGGDNILATVKRGEVILNESQQEKAGGAAFFSSIGVPGFATGGVFGVNSTVTSPIQQASTNIDNIANRIVEGINNIKVVTVVDDVTNAQAIQSEIVNGADI